MSIENIARLNSSGFFRSKHLNDVGSNYTNYKLPFKKGIFELNCCKIQLNSGDSLKDIEYKINKKSKDTGISARIVKATYGCRLVLESKTKNVKIYDIDHVLLNLYQNKCIGKDTKNLIQIVRTDYKILNDVTIHYKYSQEQKPVQQLQLLTEQNKFVISAILLPSNHKHKQIIVEKTTEKELSPSPLLYGIEDGEGLNSNEAVPEDMINHTKPSYEEFIIDHEEPIEPYRFNFDILINPIKNRLVDHEEDMMIEEMIEPVTIIMNPPLQMTTATSVALKSVVLSQNQTPILPNEPHMPDDSPSQTHSSVPTVTSNTVNKISAEIDKNIADAKNMHKKIKALETHQQFFEMRNYIFGRTTTEQRAYIKDKTKIKLGTLKSLNIKNMQELEKIFDSPYLESVITKNIMEKATKKAESLAKEQARINSLHTKVHKLKRSQPLIP